MSSVKPVLPLLCDSREVAHISWPGSLSNAGAAPVFIPDLLQGETGFNQGP